MSALRAQLDPRAVGSTRRSATRRKLRLEAQGSVAAASTDVQILDVSTTGILLETAADLTTGETIELDIPEASAVRATVKWSSGRLFGCQFKEPISSAAVSAALLRAPYEPARPSMATELPTWTDPQGDNRAAEQPAGQEDLSFSVKVRWVAGLAVLSWVLVAAIVSLLWQYLL